MSPPASISTCPKTTDTAKRSGTPQILLPAWFDCYEFATRIEWLGSGIWGNRGHAPGIDADQFGDALERALVDKAMKAKAA